jgi:hypothetical protein
MTLALAGTCLAQDAKRSAAERDFQRFDGNQSGWLSGKELAACQCKSYDRDGDNEVTKAEFFAGRGVALQTNKPTDDDDEAQTSDDDGAPNNGSGRGGEAKNARQVAPTNRTRNQPQRKGEGVVSPWYYIALVSEDGSEKELSNRESYLDLKADGTFENSLGALGGRGSQIGTYRVKGNQLTLNAENREPKTYTMTFGDDGKRTHGLSGKTLKLVNKDGIGYKLER